jgi:hypothetical protein
MVIAPDIAVISGLEALEVATLIVWCVRGRMDGQAQRR